MNSKFVVLAILALTSSAWATCDHPYFPAALGMSWTYSSGAAGNSVDSTTRVINTDAQSHVTETLSKTTIFRQKVKCQPDGSLIIGTDMTYIGSDGSSVKSESVSLSGVSIPAPQYWVVGNQWTYASTTTIVSVHNAKTIVKTETHTVDSKIVGSEMISVPAGRFTTLKVIQTFNLNRTEIQNGSPIISQKTMTSTVWFARGVGAVKFSGDNYTTLLTNFVKP